MLFTSKVQITSATVEALSGLSPEFLLEGSLTANREYLILIIRTADISFTFQTKFCCRASQGPYCKLI